MPEKLKLYRIDYMDDCDDDVCLMVSKSERDVKEKFEKEVFSKLSCPMFYYVFEIDADVFGANKARKRMRRKGVV